METAGMSNSSIAKSTIRKVIKAKVKFEYDAMEEDELSLKVGDIITEVESESEDEEWYSGILNKRKGIFPKSYVELFEEHVDKPQRPPRRNPKDKVFGSCSNSENWESSKTPQTSDLETSSLKDHNAGKAQIVQQHFYAHNIAMSEGQVHTADIGYTSTMNVGQPQETKSIADSIQKDNRLQKLLISINQDTYTRTQVKVTEGFETGNIAEPDSVFHPQISEVPDFYKGIHVEEDQFPEEFIEDLVIDDDLVSPEGGSSSEDNPTQKNQNPSLINKIKRLFQSRKRKRNQKIQQQEKKKRMEDKRLSQLARKKRVEDTKKLQMELKQKRFEYMKDRLFEFRDKGRQKTFTFQSMTDIISKSTSKVGVLAIVSQAGSGKTTFMKQAGRVIMEMSGITPERNFQPTSDSRFKLVVYRDFKSIDRYNITTLLKLLFKSYCINEEEEKLLYGWVMKNQSEVGLFFDGYDQAAWNISKEHCNKYSGPHQEANTQITISNLLAGKTLPEACIVISSREFKAAELPDYARPKKVFTLTGFNEDDAGKLFNKLVSSTTSCQEQPKSDDQELEKPTAVTKKSNPWNQISTSSPLLTSFLSIPVFLVFSAIIFTSNIASLPSTMTGLLSQVLHLLHSSHHFRYQENSKNLIAKLKRLAHDGMVDGYVLFKPDHLHKHDLKVEEVSDLLLGIPKNKCLNQCLFESDFFIFFCHQSIQEFLSACFISEMNIEQFQIFVKDHLHLPRWSIVRRFVFGLVYNIKGGDFVSILNREEKKAILFESLTSEVVNVKKYELLEFFQTLFESNDDELIKSHVQNIKLSRTPLGINEVKLLSYILSRCSKIDHLSLNSCGLNDELLGIMKIANVHIGSLKLRWDQISFAPLNRFLDNLQVGELLLNNHNISGKGGLNWKNVSKVTLYVLLAKMVFTNEGDSIKVESRTFHGIFNKDNETLEIEVETNAEDGRMFPCMTIVEKFLQPTSVNCNDGITLLPQQYLEYEALEKMLNWNVNFKIPEVVLNCRDAEEISPSVIRSFKEKYQVDALNIAVRIHQSSIGESFYEESTSIKIHVWEKVEDQIDITYMATILKENKADNLTVAFDGFDLATEDIVLLINSCRSKAFTLIYDEDGGGTEDLDQSRLMEAAESSSVKLNLWAIEFSEGHSGAWLDLYGKVCFDG